MKIVFISNFLNHHQLPICLEFVRRFGNDFKFVATEKIPDERLKLGYEDMNSKYDFVLRAYDDEKDVYNIINSSDIVIIGSSPKKYVKYRLKRRIGITFLYSERIFKKLDFKSFIKMVYYKFIKEKYQNSKYFLLCSSAYAAKDYNSIGLFKNRCYKWGYFPEVVYYKNVKSIIDSKKKNSILWVGRFIDWKHPEVVLEIAKRLKKENYDFTINMIGNGNLYNYIHDSIIENDLGNNVILLGSMSPKSVRKYMEKSDIFLFTSDRGEGWGAVLNEAMNSLCYVIANHKIGSAPFLINDGINGFLYRDNDINDLYSKVTNILANNVSFEKIRYEAYRTMIDVWNPKIAIERFINISNDLLTGNTNSIYDDGPCSVAEKIEDDWY